MLSSIEVQIRLKHAIDALEILQRWPSPNPAKTRVAESIEILSSQLLESLRVEVGEPAPAQPYTVAVTEGLDGVWAHFQAGNKHFSTCLSNNPVADAFVSAYRQNVERLNRAA